MSVVAIGVAFLTFGLFIFIISCVVPPIVYGALRCCFGYVTEEKSFAEKDREEDKRIAAKYLAELTELTDRLNSADGPGSEYGNKILELSALQSRVEQELHEITTKRRDRRRQKTKKANCRRLWSLFMSIGTWLWIIHMIIFFGLGAIDSSTIILTGAIVTPFLVISIMYVYMESFLLASEFKYLGKLSNVGTATERIATMISAQPSITMRAECFHFEPREVTITQMDGNGNMYTTTIIVQEKIVTADIKENFQFGFWCDKSDGVLADIRQSGVTKIRMHLDVQLGDEDTSTRFYQTFKEFREKYAHRDVFVEYSTPSTVPGFEERLFAFADAGTKPWWMCRRYYVLATLCLLTWPYRIVFNRAIARTTYNIVKVVFIDQPEMPDDSAYPGSCRPRPPSYVNMADSIALHIKSLIETIETLSQSLGGGASSVSWTDDSNNNNYTNVQLKPATHDVQVAINP